MSGRPLAFLHYQAESKACDQCNLRKLRVSLDFSIPFLGIHCSLARQCDRQRPCRRCTNQHFACTFEKKHKRRGPLGRFVPPYHLQNSIRLTSAVIESRTQEIRKKAEHPPEAMPESHSCRRDGAEVASPDSGDHTSSPDLLAGDGSWASIEDVLHHEVYNLAPVNSIFLPGQDEWSALTQCTEHEGSQSFDQTSALDSLLSPDRVDQSQPPSIFEYPSFGLQPPAVSGSLVQCCWPAMVKEAFLLPLIDTYSSRLYATAPIFKRSYLHQRMIAQDHRSCPQFGAMLLALGAFMLIQPILVDERSSMALRRSQALHLMGEAAKLRCIPDFGQKPSLEAVLTSYFLFGCHFGLGQDNAAWFRLKEAVTLGDMMGLQDPVSCTGLSEEEKLQRLRAYWILSVTERYYPTTPQEIGNAT
jgi:hypothetical protein